MTLRVALGQYDISWHDPAVSLDRAANLVASAADGGAELVILPEMCTTGFTMDAERYSETLNGDSVQALRNLAARFSVALIAGVATRNVNGSERFYNSSILIGRDGAIVAEYRKQRLFAFAEEERVYTPGDGSVIVTINDVRIAMFICFDLRFPELFREIAPEVDAISVIASWPATRQLHWETLLRARAIESQAYVAGVNRTGHGGAIDYEGGSALYGPWGELVVQANGNGRVAIATIDASNVADARAKFPFVDAPRGSTL